MASDIAGSGLEGPCLCLGESGGWRGGCRRSCLVDLGLHVSAALAAFLPERAAVLEHDDACVPQLAGSKHEMRREERGLTLSPVAVGAVQGAHTLVVSVAGEAAVAGGSPGGGEGQEAGQEQREQETHGEGVTRSAIN